MRQTWLTIFHLLYFSTEFYSLMMGWMLPGTTWAAQHVVRSLQFHSFNSSIHSSIQPTSYQTLHTSPCAKLDRNLCNICLPFFFFFFLFFFFNFERQFLERQDYDTHLSYLMATPIGWKRSHELAGWHRFRTTLFRHFRRNRLPSSKHCVCLPVCLPTCQPAWLPEANQNNFYSVLKSPAYSLLLP